jgi:hypothetical protein
VKAAKGQWAVKQGATAADTALSMLPARSQLAWASRALAILCLAASLAYAGNAWRDGRDGPSASAAAARGNLALDNSRPGSAILSATGIVPGDSSSGSVTIRNAGELTGVLRLSKSHLNDVPGGGGGRLSNALDLVVTDVSAGSAAIVYSGKLAAMSTQRLGVLRAGKARHYHFAVTLPDGGAPAPGAIGDNAYKGASMTADFDWNATTDGTRDAGRGDAFGLRVKLASRRRQAVRRRRLVVLARCNEQCTLRATLRLPGGSKRRTVGVKLGRRSVPSNRRVRVKLVLPRRARKAIRRALAKRRRVGVRVTVRAADRAGNVATARRRIVVVRPRR